MLSNMINDSSGRSLHVTYKITFTLSSCPGDRWFHLVCTFTCSDGACRHGLEGLSPQNVALAPIVKHTGQESGGELCEIFKF